MEKAVIQGGIGLEQVQRARKFGVSVVLLTVLFRVFELGIPQTLLEALLRPAFTIHRETEQPVRSFSFPYPYESAPPVDDSPKLPAFTAADVQALDIRDSSRREPDYAALMEMPLDWALMDTAPTVLILHTHTSESYETSENSQAAYRSLDETANMLSIGDRLAERLEQEGIRVIHDREYHDYPDYNTAYTHARKQIQTLLKQNPGILLVLDLHRDAAGEGDEQLTTHARVNGEDSAQLMLVLGLGSAGLPNDRWADNLSLALKLQATLEAQCPGICRPMSLRDQRFNQDLAPYSLLVEVGAAGDTQQEALTAADQLAKALAALKYGTG